MGKIKKIISAVMAGMTLFSMAPVNAESYNGEAETTQISESVWEKAGSFIKNLFLPQVFAAEDDIARGTSGGVTWVIDAEGTLTLSPTNGISGTMESLDGGTNDAPWYNYNSEIKKAVAEPGVALGEIASSLFNDCKNLCELDLNNLDVSNVTKMNNIFGGCSNLTSLEGLATWNTESATNMAYMFSNCSNLTSLDGLADWKTGNVEYMSRMFYDCSNLTSLKGLAKWDTGSVTNMPFMFSGCKNLTSLDGLDNWQTGSVTDMSSMFYRCSSLTSLEGLAKWETGSVTNMSYMFCNCSNLTSLDGLDDWQTGSVTDMGYMFKNCNGLTSIDGLAKWDTGSVTNMYEMFYWCNDLTSLKGLADWETGSVTSMGYMFFYCSGLTSLEPLAGWDTGSVMSMGSMFRECSSLTSLVPLADWDTGSVTSMSEMFYRCSGLTSLEPLAGWDTGSVTSMFAVFADCSGLTSLGPLAGWDTGSVTSMSSMFDGCSSVESADFSNWNFPSKKRNMYRIFGDCSSLSEITIPDSLNFSDTHIPSPQSNSIYTGNWTYGDPYNHNPEDVLSGGWFSSGTHRAGTWYWEKKGEKPPAQNHVSNSNNIFIPEYIENDDGSTSLKQLPEEVFAEDGYWQQQDDNTWVYTFYVYDASVQWYVWEEPIPEGYISDAPKDNPIIIENGSIIATVTNTLETMPKEFGKMSVQKQLVNETDIATMEDRSFPFRVTISDVNNQQLTGAKVFGGVTFQNGVAYMSVKPDETVTIKDIPAGYHYIVEELPDDKYIQEIANNSGVIQAENEDVSTYVNDAAGLVVATNTRISESERTYGSLTLRKEVTGNVDTEEGFNFVVSFGNLESETTYTYGDKTFTSDYDGSADVEVNLKNGEEVTFENLPSNTQYRILEKAGDYTSSYIITDSNNLGLINQTEDANEKENEELATATEVLDEGENVTVVFTNDILKTQNLSISKIVKDSSGQVISDNTRYEFSIEFADAVAGIEITSDLGVLRTDEEGKVYASFYLENGETLKFSGIPVGAKYRLTEVENNAIASYAITDTLENENTVKQSDANTVVKKELSTELETVDNNEDSEITFTNTYIKGALTVIKRSSDGNLLMGAEFHLTDSNGTIYEPENVATDANGRNTWTELPFGTYTLTETKAPAGATLMKEPVQVEITENAPDVTLEIVDNSAIFLDAGGTGLIAWMTISSAVLALAMAYLLNSRSGKRKFCDHHSNSK